MSRFRSEVLQWFDAGRVPPGREEEALRASGILPSRADWYLFFEKLTLWLGIVALAAAAIFFFAFNWEDLGRFAKLGLVEAAILGGLIALWWTDIDRIAAKAVLVLLTLLVGALLALTGQIYQTGADTYELFAWWALLILPWVLVSRFSPLWIVWLVILNLAVFLYFLRGSWGDALIWSLFGLNTLALAGWEAAHRRGTAWLEDDWPPRLVAIASGFWATALAIQAVVDSRGGEAAVAALVYLGWLVAIYGWYRHVRVDLFMLAGGVLSLIVTVAIFLTDNLGNRGDAGAFLIIGLVVIGMSGAGAVWLRNLAREQSA